MSKVTNLLDRLSDSDRILDFLIEVLVASSDISEEDEFLITNLLVLLDRKSLFNLITYMGGRTIRIPTLDEVYGNLTDIIAVYYYDRGESLDFINSDLDTDYSESYLSSKSELYSKIISKFNIPRSDQV